MSNFLAIATVTATLSQVLQSSVNADVPGATITTTRPEATGGAAAGAAVNIFLYQVVPNAAWRNDDLPTRRADGTVVDRPRYACDLRYLLTFHGDETRLEPQRLLGSVARTLHARPTLSRASIAAAIANPAFGAFLSASNLAAIEEPIRITPTSLSLEELSKVWSIFYQTPYALTLAYECTVVLIESDDVAQEALPVRERFITAIPLRDPRITAVTPALITSGASVTLTGASLASDGVLVQIGDTSVAAAAPANDTLQFTLPAELPAGVLPLQVVQPVPLSAASKTTFAMRSDPVPLVLRPTVSKASFANVIDAGDGTRTATLQCTVAPPIAPGQRVVLLLNAAGTGTQSPSGYLFDVPAAQSSAAASAALSVQCAGLVPGTYLVRVQVDGAESTLGTNASGVYDSPAVTLA